MRVLLWNKWGSGKTIIHEDSWNLNFILRWFLIGNLLPLISPEIRSILWYLCLEVFSCLNVVVWFIFYRIFWFKGDYLKHVVRVTLECRLRQENISFAEYCCKNLPLMLVNSSSQDKHCCLTNKRLFCANWKSNLLKIFSPFPTICKTICLYTWIIKQFYDGILTWNSVKELLKCRIEQLKQVLSPLHCIKVHWWKLNIVLKNFPL